MNSEIELVRWLENHENLFTFLPQSSIHACNIETSKNSQLIYIFTKKKI